MGRLLLLLLVVAFVVAINPSLRAKAAPYVQPALDPLYAWSAKGKVQDIAQALEGERTAGRAVPGPREFEDFLRRHYVEADAHLDPWGTPYFLKRERGAVRVGSAGTDRRPHTADDLLSPPVATR